MNRLRFDITSQERTELQSLIDICLEGFQGFENEEFLKNLPLYAYKLPDRLVKFLNEFKYEVSEQGYAIVSLGMLDEALGATPAHWELETNNDTCMRNVMAMSLCATILGDIYGWLTQQDGRMIHDILPIKKHETEQLGCGSREELTWHTEDAFHELRGDYLILMCLRNNDQVPTTLSKPDYSKLTKKQIDLLFEKQYVIKPDNSHQDINNSTHRSLEIESQPESKVQKAYLSIKDRADKPEKIAVLFGDKKDPCLRMDPYFMEEPETPEAREALNALIDLVGSSIIDLSLNPGEFLVVDNFEVVHGRRSFQAKFDGTDRWYKRINVIRDIRRCNHVLETKKSRVVY